MQITQHSIIQIFVQEEEEFQGSLEKFNEPHDANRWTQEDVLSDLVMEYGSDVEMYIDGEEVSPYGYLYHKDGEAFWEEMTGYYAADPVGY